MFPHRSIASSVKAASAEKIARAVATVAQHQGLSAILAKRATNVRPLKIGHLAGAYAAI